MGKRHSRSGRAALAESWQQACESTAFHHSAWFGSADYTRVADARGLFCGVRCRALLQWAESPGGKAQIAVELKALRSRASARLVRDMLATSEGKEGLIRGLQAVLASDNTLGTQLRALVGGGR